MSLDLGPSIRAALIGNGPIAALLDSYLGQPAAFAFRPVPADAPELIAIINPEASIADQDGLISDRPVVIRDIVFYGRRGAPGAADDQSPAVEQLGYLARSLFHKKRFSVQPEGYSVIDITASGPIAAPVDDDRTIGKLVSLTIRLRRNP